MSPTPSAATRPTLRRTPTAPQQALHLGHNPSWDPELQLPTVQRWTCDCGCSVLRDHLGAVSGDATTQPCPDDTADTPLTGFAEWL